MDGSLCRRDSGTLYLLNATANDTEYNPDKALAELLDQHIMKRGIPIVSALGLLGNSLSLLVLTKEKLRQTLTKMEISAHIGLIALAVSDLLFCLMVLLVTTLPLKDVYQHGDALLYFHLLSSGLITVFINTSTWLIVVMAAERYVAVCHPLRARQLISLRRTRAYVVVLFLLCPLVCIPVFLESYILDERCNDGRWLQSVERVLPESIVVRRVVWAICFDFIPCFALVYFNTCLIWNIHKAKQLRERMAPYLSSTASSRSSSSRNLHHPHHHRNNAGNAQGPCARSCQPSKMRKFRWDGSNTTQFTNNSDKRNGGRGRASGDNRNNGNSSSGGRRGGGLLFPGRRSKGKSSCDTTARDLLDSSESNDLSLQSNAVGSAGGGSQRELKREMMLLCQHDTNGTAKTSARLAGCPTSPNRAGGEGGVGGGSVQGRQKRTLSSKRRFSDNALNSVTATLVAVVLFFLILVSPWELVKFGLEYGGSSVDNYKKDIANSLTNFTQVINFSSNFVLYFLVNKSFRTTLRKLICFES